MTKTLRRVVSVVAALAVMMLMVVPFGTAPSAPQKAWGEGETSTAKEINSNQNGSASITITNAQKGATYNVYKVFDATSDGSSANISYKVMSSKADKELPSGFVTDAAGNVIHGTKDNQGTITKNTAESLTQNEIEAIASYVRDDTAVATGSIETSDSQTNLKFTNLEYGYYYVTSTIGSAVSVTSTNPNAEITDKNETPTVDKTITAVDDNSTDSASVRGSVATSEKNAIAEVGSTVHFQSIISVKAGAENYKFRDNMNGQPLTLNTGSITVQYKKTSADSWTNLTESTDYTLNTTAVRSGDDQYTFEVAFDKSTNAANAALTAGAQIKITYTATVTSSELNTDPAKNSARIYYGNDASHKSEPSSTATYNAKLTVTKTFKNNTGADQGNVAGAGFVLRKGTGTTADPYLYYKETESNDRVTNISWTNDIDQATEQKTTTVNNQLVFQGLANGSYTLVEKTVPAGYNKAADVPVTIYGAKDTTVNGQDFQPFSTANLVHSESIENTSGPTLPTTGGPGTIWLYVVGGVLVVAAGVALIARRRMRQH